MAPVCFADRGIAKTHLSYLEVISHDVIEANQQPPLQFHMMIFSLCIFSILALSFHFPPLLNRKHIYFLCVTEENISHHNTQTPSHIITTISSYFDGLQFIMDFRLSAKLAHDSEWSHQVA